MRNLSREGLFIRSVGSQESNFEINPLVRQYLISQLKNLPELYKSLTRQCAEVLLLEDDPVHALELYFEVGDLDSAKKVIAANFRKMIYTNDSNRLRRWNKVVSRILNVGDFGVELAETYASMLGDSLSRYRQEISTFSAKIRSQAEFDIEGDLVIMSMRLDFSMGDFTKCIDHALKLPSLNMVQQEVRTAKIIAACRWAAWAAFLKEDLISLKKLYDLVRNLPSAEDSTPIIGIPAIEAMLALGEGRYKDAEELAQYVLSASEKFGFSGIFAPFDAAYVLAEVHREFATESIGMELLEKYISQAENMEIFPWVAALNAKYASLLIATNEVSEGMSKLKIARDLLQNPLLSPEIAYIIDEHELWFRYRLQDWERTNELLFRLDKTPSVVALQALIESKRKSKTIVGVISQLPRGTIRERLNYEIICAEESVKRPHTAHGHIKAAVAIATANGQRQIFLGRSDEFLNLFLEFAQTQPSVFVEQLAGLIRKRLTQTGNRAGISNSLTKRELDILRRLATGQPISQIAAGIHISNNTIKTHLKNIYKKLEVDSREAAVTKGRDLLLLS